MKPGSGLHPRPASARTLQGYFSEIDPSWSTIWYPSRKGEDVTQCHDRTEGFLTALIPEVERRFGGKHKRILLVSHAATIIALNHSLAGDGSIPMRIGCCSLSEFKRKERGSEPLDNWEMARMGDGSHLKEGSTRDWGFEDIVIADGKVRLIVVFCVTIVHTFQVVDDAGQPGSEHEVDEPVGLQLSSTDISSRM